MIGSNPQLHKSDLGFAVTRKALISLWVRWHWPDWANGDPSASPDNERALQYKFVRFAATVEPSGNVLYPSVYIASWKDYGGLGIDRTAILNNGGTLYSPNNHLINNAWHQITLLVDQGTKGNADGKVVAYFSKPGSSFITVQSATNVNIIGANEDYLNDVKIDNYIDINNQTIVASGATVSQPGIYIDDVYVDNSFQRVELCDGASKAVSSHCEMQIPSMWNDSGITAAVNRGTFPEGSQVYVVAYNAVNEAASFGPIAISAILPGPATLRATNSHGNTTGAGSARLR
jgi:hypothetical protein